MRRLVRLRRTTVALALLASGAALVLLVAAANAIVVIGGSGSDSVARAPHAEVAIVLGAKVQPDGALSSMLADRVTVAARLYRAGKVDKVLASGDHGTVAYDEVDAMKRALVAAGVSPRDVFTDHAGFDTWDTMVRARKVFEVRSALVVTQGFHLPRAVWLARQAGLDAHGVGADLHGYGKALLFSEARELLARVKAVGQAATDETPRFLGPPIPSTGAAARAPGSCRTAIGAREVVGCRTWHPAQPATGRRSRSRGCASGSATSTRSTVSTSKSRPARCSACSAPTAPARRRRCASSRRC
jgi:SanA protein